MTQSTDKKTATFVKRQDGNGEGRVYRVHPPIEITDWIDDSVSKTDHVWVSAATVPYSGPETYIFACDADGNVTNWSELHGSYKGGLSHETALTNAGYEVSS